MTNRTEMERFIAWCHGIGLDGSRDYHAIDSITRFRNYEQHIAAEATKKLIERHDGSAKTEG